MFYNVEDIESKVNNISLHLKNAWSREGERYNIQLQQIFSLSFLNGYADSVNNSHAIPSNPIRGSFWSAR